MPMTRDGNGGPADMDPAPRLGAPHYVFTLSSTLKEGLGEAGLLTNCLIVLSSTLFC